MPKFITGSELNLELERLIQKAEEEIILISPYIKLHDRYKALLKEKLERHDVSIIVIFGKNEHDYSKSISKEDLDFFMSFPHVEIKYEKRLHAKYYANEFSSILTSMNLYSYSHNNNIEFGIYAEPSFIGSSLDTEAIDYFATVIDQAETIFRKEPEYERGLLGFTKKYVGSVVREDIVAEFFSAKADVLPVKKKQIQQGFCIRTGVSIPFNLQKPMAYTAYKLWAKYKDKDYKEKYCHFSGEESNGETSVHKPILKKNWKTAAEVHAIKLNNTHN